MKRTDFHYIISILLFFSISITGILGYIQSQFELRKFVPHRYFAYTTLCLAAVHFFLKSGKVWKYIRGKVKNQKLPYQKEEL
jgi:hypothetical protein